MKKNQKNLMMGGLALGGVYLLTKSNSSSLLPRSRSVRASSANETGVTPGLLYFISESTEWNDHQIVQPAFSPTKPKIIIPYAPGKVVTYFMSKGMSQDAAVMEGKAIAEQGYPSVLYRLESLHNRADMTAGDKKEILAHLNVVYNEMGTPFGQRI